MKSANPWCILALVTAAGFLLYCEATARSGVIKIGTTMAPGFTVKQGKKGEPCPASHPKSLAAGAACCSSSSQTVECGSGVIEFHTPIECCPDFVECPPNRVCKDKPIDAKWSKWSSWSPNCIAQETVSNCTRYRRCIPPRWGGNPKCNGVIDEVLEGCFPCPINGFWSAWHPWEDCSATCEGTQRRTATCTNPPPLNGGSQCEGNQPEESQGCNTINCPINGEWGAWEAWGTCSVTCGGGVQLRQRECDNPPPQFNGNDCVGSLSDDLHGCNSQHCPINGAWGDWTGWGQCTVTCAGGTQSRTRECKSPSPQYGGKECNGNANEEQDCNTLNCPINGAWSLWNEWGSCTVTCGGGTQSRVRACDNPTPQYGGNNCVGENGEEQVCNTLNCPVNGAWSDWSGWSDCTVSCGGGTQSKTRTCNSPAPQYGGKDCSGSNSDSQECNNFNCPINGAWGQWDHWTTCTLTCGGGVQTRGRACNNPAPQFGGSLCNGDLLEEQECNMLNCPINGAWSAWSGWTSCSVTCAGGSQSRTRSCTNPSPQYNGQNCVGDSAESHQCNTLHCPINGSWNNWGGWTSCSVTCGGGSKSRTRACNNPPPQYNGNDCPGSSGGSQTCNTLNCPIHGGWSNWGGWGSCSATCGTATKQRSRSCNNPAPQYNGNSCSGSSSDSVSCSLNACPAVASGPYGTVTGTSFSEKSYYDSHGLISEMIIKAGWAVDAVQVKYGSTWAPHRGGSGGGRYHVKFQSGEKIIRVEGCQHGYFPLCGFKITTTQSSYGWYGRSTSGYYNTAQSGCHVSYISGTISGIIMSISWHWACG